MTTALDNVARLNGLELMQAVADGELPPPTIAVLLGMRPVEIGDGVVTFEMQPDERMMNPIGSVHGGIAATLLDSAMACAVHTTLPAGWGYTTAQLGVHYLRSMQPGMGPVRAVGTVLPRGRRQSTAEGKLYDAEGRVLAHGTTTCLILRGDG
jgi:uncharacterized protein (TIGR00369 family)